MTHTHDSETELAQLRQRIAALEAENARYQQLLDDLSQLRFAVEHSANPITIADTKARAIKADIAGAKQLLDVMRQSEANHRQIVELSPDAIIVHREGKLLFVNIAAVALIGAKHATQLVGTSIMDFVPPDTREMVRTRMTQVAQGRRAEPLDQQLLRWDGTPIDVSVLSAPIIFEGETAHLAIIRDITTRKETERRLASERRFNSAVLDTVGAIIVVMDRDGRITRFNRAAEAITGYTEAEMRGTFVWDRLLLPDEVAGVQTVFEDINATGIPSRSDNHWVTKDGSRRLIAWSNTVLRDAEGEIEHLIGTGLDITERKEGERQLQTHAATAHALINAPLDIVMMLDLDGVILQCNKTLAESFDTTVEELIGVCVWERLPLAAVSFRRTLFEQAITSGKSLRREDHSRRGVWFDNVVYPIPDDTGKITRAVVVARDITERKQAERKLQASEERLALALRSADHALWDWDLETGEVVRGDLWATMLGYTPAEVEGLFSAWERLVHPDDKDPTLAAVEAHIQGDAPIYEAEYRLRTNDGHWIWVQDRGRVVEWDTDGKPCRITGMHHDITARQAAEQHLRQSEARHRAILQAVPDLIIRMNREGVFLDVIPGEGVPLIGSADEQVGKHVTDIMPPQIAQQVLSRVRRTLDTGEMQQTEYTLDMEGTPRHFVARSVVYGPHEVLTMIHDVTARKMMEQRVLELAIERQRVEVLTNFITAASHEFRTPLSVIGLNTYLLEKVPDREKHGHYLSEISAQIAHLVKLVDGLLIMARLDSNVAPQRRPIDARQIASWITSNYQEIASGFGVTLVCDCADMVPPVHGDPDLLLQALGHILDNALRYTPAGGTVTVDAEVIATQVAFVVSDTGPGLSDVERERMFERFYRGDEAHSTRGFGLGLPIAQAIVELHGGWIEVESIQGEGSTFRMLLPQGDAGA